MDVHGPRAAGLDVHKKSVVACGLTPEGRQTRTFGTMTADLLALADGLVGQRGTQVARESTGVFWKPVYNVQEEEPTLKVMVVTAQHSKAVPGRKTDVTDTEWIADLVRPSFILDRPERELRELVRYRRTRIQATGAGGEPHPEAAGRRHYQTQCRGEGWGRRLGPGPAGGAGGR